PGLASSNNIKFAANGKFLVTAPFEPSTATRLGDALPFGELDNDHLLVVNIQDPSAAPVRLDLIDRQGNRYYYPSNVLYDAPTNSVFVRVTRIDRDGSEAGEFIVYGRLAADGSAWSGDLVPILIPPIGDGADSAFMPTSFGLGRDSKILVYTNGS